jgi:hypothetical protein
LQPLGGQRVSLDQRSRLFVPMETDDCDGVRSVAERQAGRLDVEAENAGPAGLVEPPMFAPVQP